MAMAMVVAVTVVPCPITPSPVTRWPYWDPPCRLRMQIAANASLNQCSKLELKVFYTKFDLVLKSWNILMPGFKELS